MTIEFYFIYKIKFHNKYIKSLNKISLKYINMIQLIIFEK